MTALDLANTLEVSVRTLTLISDSLVDARRQLLGLGVAVEVLSPEPLRLSLVDFAQQIVRHYHDEQFVYATTPTQV